MLGLKQLRDAVLSLAGSLRKFGDTVEELNAGVRVHAHLDGESDLPPVVSARVASLPAAESEEPETVANGKKGRKS